MTLDPRIILAGQSPDVMGSMSRGIQTGQQMRQAQTQNALADVYKTQGAGILAGDQGALNALAGIDPGAALKVQESRLGMDATRQGMENDKARLQLAYDQAKRQAAEYAAGLSAADRQAQAQKIEAGLSGAAHFYQTGDKAGYDNFLRQNGLDPAATPFEQFPAYAAQYKGALDALKEFAPKQISPNDRFKVAGNTLFDLGAEGGPKPVGQGAMPEETIFDPATGNPIIRRGSPTKFTEGQSKDNVYATRARGALEKLEPVADKLTSRVDRVGDMIPLGIGREIQGDDYQVAANAGEEYLQAILRKDTGAAITKQEQELYGKTYLPQPGDGPAVLQAKREARARALAAIEAGMTIDQIAATERALIDAASRVGNAPTQGRGAQLDAARGGKAPEQPQAPRRFKFNPETGELE